jgi:diaminopimelate decarboxylase
MAEPSPRPSSAEELPAPPWPATALRGPWGLEVGGLALTELADRFGTPLLVVDEEEVRDRARAIAGRFPRVLYAVKAFTAHAVLRLVLDEGLDLLASTGGEVEACLRAGAPASRIVLHGNNKTDEELALAVGSGVSLVVVDHRAELERLDAVARSQSRVQPVLLRVVPEVEVATHEAIATGHDASKFGMALADAPGVIEAAASMTGIRFDGIHAHVGSQVLDLEPYLRSLDRLVQTLAEIRDRAGVTAAVLDLGGGFGVTYVDERPLATDALAVAVTDRLAERCSALDLQMPSLIVEPGRSIVANAGLTVYRVGSRKQVGSGRTLLAVDGGMSDNVRPMLYDARYTVASVRPPADGDLATFTVVGRHCESGDTLAEDVHLPADAGPGDLLAFAATGAYTYSLASSYNRVGRPAVVGVRDGLARLWLRREDAADLDRLEGPAPRAAIVAEAPEGITIRPAAPRDADSYIDFWTAVVAEGRYVRTERVSHSKRVYRSRFRRPWTDHEAQIVAVDAQGTVVGHIYIQRERHPVTHHVATLGIAVAADHRGRGVGSALLADAIVWARGVGVEKLVLSVYPHNTGAIALYRKFGFVQEGRLSRQSRKSYGDEDEILMAAWIAGEDLEGTDRP